MTTILYHLAPLLGLVAVGVLLLRAMKRRDHVTAARPNLKPLSEPTQTTIESLSMMYEPYAEVEAASSIPISDIVSVYINSRGNRDAANDARIEFTQPECASFLSRVTRDHDQIKRMAIAATAERVVGKLVPGWRPLYSRILLWTYGDQQELLNQLAEYCAGPRRETLLSRLD